MAPLLHSSNAAALDCGILPQTFCSAAESPTTNNPQDSGVWKILLLVINILVAGVGILALIGIIYGAMLYTSSGGNPEQVKKAKGIFTNVVIGVGAFALMYVFLQWLVPGGVFN